MDVGWMEFCVMILRLEDQIARVESAFHLAFIIAYFAWLGGVDFHFKRPFRATFLFPLPLAGPLSIYRYIIQSCV